MGDRTYRHEPAITDNQERFAIALAAGMPQTDAARVAGYADPRVAGVRLSRSDAVRARVRALRTNEIDKLASLSLRVLKELLSRKPDPEKGIFAVSDAVRLNAVKLSLALAGHTEKPSEEAKSLKSKDIEAMSVDELDAFIASERNKRAADAKPIIDHEGVQSQGKPLKHNDMSEPFAGSVVVIDGEATRVDDVGQTDGAAEGEP